MASIKDLKRNRGGLWILIITAVILETTAVLQYYYSEHIIKVAAELLVQSELRNINASVECIADSTASVQLNYIVERMKQYPNCYYTLTDAQGAELLPPPDTIVGDKYHRFSAAVGTHGWQLSLLIPDADLYGQLRRLGGLVTILMLLGLALLVFIIYRSAKNIISLINVQESKQRIESELQIARNIQMAMLPKTFPPYPDHEDLNMHGIIIPAKEVGGDLYDFYVRDNRLLFCIGDVSGKGVPASLVMAVTRSLFRTTSAHENDTAKITATMNEAMAEMNEQNMFVTLFVGALDLTTGQLDYCNAGHNAPVLVESRKYKVESIKSKVESLPCLPNIPLGVLPGYEFSSQQLTMHAGDSLFLYTDGLTEAENIGKQLFGEQRMMAAISRWSDRMDSKQRVEAMRSEVQAFVANAEHSDDLTMLSIIWSPVADKKDR